MSRPTIPARGRAHAEVLDTMAALKGDDADWKNARTFSLVYYAGEAHHELLRRAHELFFAENALNPMAFKSLKKMEAEVVAMSASMLHGPDTTVGTMTTGGTESILMAVKAARDRAKATKPWILRPEVVVPATIHVAFDKAAHYFGVELVKVPVDRDQRASVKRMKKAIGSSTILVAASAPQYPHGVLDPIEELAALAEARGVPFHVDACVGGFILPWVEKLGYPVAPFDFRVPGVTSMSADLHKYGFAAKGASVVLYRDMSYLKHQFFVATDWCGGIYASPSMTGTRAGGPIAAAWASLMAMGEDGFLDHTRCAMDVAKRLRAGLAKIPELEVIGDPVATIVTYKSRDRAVDIYAVADRLEDRGWSADRQQRPACIHCTLTSNHVAHLDEYLEDLAEAVAFVKANPELATRGNAAMYGMMAKVPLRGLVKQGVLDVMQSMYAPAGSEPASGDLAAQAGPVGKLIDRYGPKISAALDKLEDVKERFARRRD